MTYAVRRKSHSVCFEIIGDMGWFYVLRIGVSDLHHGDGAVGAHPGDAVYAAQVGITAENVCPAVLSAEDGPLGEHRQTIEGCGVDGTGDGICLDLIVDGHIDAVVVAVECHRLYIYIRIEQLRIADPGTGSGIQHLLGALG